MIPTNQTLRYRCAFDIFPLKEDVDPFMAAAERVANWVVDKELAFGSSPIADDLGGERGAFPRAWSYHSPEGYRGGAYDGDRWPALACEAAADEASRITQWVAEYDEPDATHADHRWHTTFYLERHDDGGCHLAMENACYSLIAGEEPPDVPIAAPSIVRALLDLPWLVARGGTTQLQTVPNKLSPQTFEHFRDALIDPGRTIPLLLFCTGYDGHVPEQAKQVARRCAGNANAYILDWSNEELRDLEQQLFVKGEPSGEYACPKSSARMYLPGIDLSDHNASMSHVSWNRAALSSVRPSVFAERLARRFLPNKPTPTIQSLWPDPDEPEGYDGPSGEW